MGFISRKVIPACGNMCICCPALRPSSRQPVKRYKKLLGEIFPKSLDGPANERKITKLCEYAKRNPFRIPKIAKFLEQKTYKELRAVHVNHIRIIMEIYSKLLCLCREQMVYFASSILNVIDELLDNKWQDTLRIIGCRTLTTFMYSQADGTYAHNIEMLACKACSLARVEGEESSKKSLRAASLECLASMVWFMSTFSHIFSDFDEIVLVTLENYGTGDRYCDGDDGDEEALHHNWVEAVTTDAGVAPVICNESGFRSLYTRRRPEIKDSSVMTREERETPEIWARICTKRLIEMAKESTTMRRTLDPMFTHFDTKKLWDPQQGLALIVLSDLMHFLRDSGKEQAILAPVIRHLDHKNVVHDSQIKLDIVQTVIGLIRQLGSQNAVLEVGIINDLCRNLRKSFQASLEVVGLQESNWNSSLQSSIEDCLLEISKGINDAKPLFDMMTITLEELPAVGVDARATTGSLLILAYMISTFIDLPANVLPESLFLQLLKAMMHPDVDVRVGVHRIFSVLLVRCANSQRQDGDYVYPEYIHESRRWDSRTSGAFASAAALLERLRREKDCGNAEKVHYDTCDDNKERDTMDEEWKLGRMRSSSPNFYKISCSIIDRNACSTTSIELEPKMAVLNDDQIAQLLSAFWIQSNKSDNLPSNYEAIAQSFCLTLLSARLKNSNHQNAVRIFQLPLSIMNASLGSDAISPSCRRSLFILSMVMLNFGGRSYNIPELCNIIKSMLSKIADPFLDITDDFQLFVRPKADAKEYGSGTDQMEAISYLENLRKEFGELDLQMVPIIAHNLAILAGLEEDNVVRQLFETITPEDGLLFGPSSVFAWFHNPEVAHSDEAFSVDEEYSTMHSIDGDTVGESPAPAELLHSFSKKSTTPALPQVIGVGQLLESALQVAGQVAGTTVSTSPLPYGTLASHCESLGMGTRRKMSSWLSSNHDLITDKMVSLSLPGNGGDIPKVAGKEFEQQGLSTESWLAFRLPPASPFDNFLKAARY